MSNIFGKTLQSQLEKFHIKQSQLADALSYDVTYISKWINGRKLPAYKNVRFIISEIAQFIVSNSEEDNLSSIEEIENLLLAAYDEDLKKVENKNKIEQHMEFVNGRKALLELTKVTLREALMSSEKNVNITATFDLFKHFGAEFSRMIRVLSEESLKEIRLKIAINKSDIEKSYQGYVSGILDIIGNIPAADISMVEREIEKPKILIINDLLCVQILWDMDGDLTSIFSTDKETIDRFRNVCDSIIDDSEKLFNSVDPLRLRKTNVQLDSYSDNRQWLFFNDAPALLLPDSIFEYIVDVSEDIEYIRYLEKLKKVFNTTTKKSHIKLLIYSSAINRYIAEGHIKIGNIEYKLKENHMKDHLKHLSNIMLENSNFSVYMIKDTVMLSHELRHSPSIFIDNHSVYIEDSKNDKNDNFHLSMETVIRDSFTDYFENVLRQPFCTKLTAEDLLRYII